jgi:hypothetical protein
MEDLQDTEKLVRQDPKVIEQCKILGIEDMSKVYCDRELSSLHPYPDSLQFFFSMDNWLRRAFRQQSASATGTDVLPAARRRHAICLPS